MVVLVATGCNDARQKGLTRARRGEACCCVQTVVWVSPPRLLLAAALAHLPLLSSTRSLVLLAFRRTSEDCNGNECFEGKKCECDEVWTGPQCRAAAAGDDYVYEVHPRQTLTVF